MESKPELDTETVSSAESPGLETPSLLELAFLFLRLGLTAFGGPAAHIAMMQQEFVERRRWLTQEQYLDLIGVANLLPGPSSTEVAIYIGYRQAGWRGLLLAGTCFILPAYLLVLGIAWAYKEYGSRPQSIGVLYGIKPVVIAVVVQALWNLGRTALKSRLLAGIGLVALALAGLRFPPALLLLAAGGLVGSLRWFGEKPRSSLKPLRTPLVILLAFIGTTLLLSRLLLYTSSFSLQSLFLVFLKIGSEVYGSGYVLLSFLRGELVTGRGWLTSAQLLDAVAVGQVTPGPVFTTATFIGYVLAGPRGALLATLGIFLPAFLLVGVTGPLLLRIRQSPLAGAFLDGVNIAAVALMGIVSWELARTALIDGLTVALAVGSALLLVRYRVNAVWLVVAGAALGMISPPLAP